jgi:hypothetical protein
VYAAFHTTDTTIDKQDIFTIAVINPVVRDIQTRIPAALTTDGNIKADALRIGGTAQTGADVVANVSTILGNYARRTGDYATAASVSAIPTNPLLANSALLPATVIAAKADIALTLGAGSKAYTPNKVTDPLGNPLDGVDTWVGTSATDSSIGVMARASTISTGFVSTPFMLDPGTYYVWRQLGGYTFSNPETVVVT